MSTQSTKTARPDRERLHFNPALGGARARDYVNALIGVASALDFGVISRDQAHERETLSGLAAAARVLSEELAGRLEFD